MECRRGTLRAATPVRQRAGFVAVATGQVEERWQAVRGPESQLPHDVRDGDAVPLPLVVLELQRRRAAVAGEVDAGGLVLGDRGRQIVQRAQLRRRHGAAVGQRQGQPVALLLVAQAAAFRGRHIDDQTKGFVGRSCQ